MEKIYLYCFGITEDQKKLVQNIKKYLEKLLVKEIKDKQFELVIHDLKVFDCDKDTICLVFGNKVVPYVQDPKFIKQTLCVESIAENKNTVKDDLGLFVTDLKNLYNSSKIIDKTHSSYVEVNEKITASSEGAVFNFTLEEVEHLKKIKELLNGGKIIFTKGDTRLEIHD
jgi:hypothetical protein